MESKSVKWITQNKFIDVKGEIYKLSQDKLLESYSERLVNKGNVRSTMEKMASSTSEEEKQILINDLRNELKSYQEYRFIVSYTKQRYSNKHFSNWQKHLVIVVNQFGFQVFGYLFCYFYSVRLLYICRMDTNANRELNIYNHSWFHYIANIDILHNKSNI